MVLQLRHDLSEIYIPDGLPEAEALARTTHLAIGAHQDDLEIMAVDGILKCYQQNGKWFTGVVVTNGSGSPRTGIYENYTGEEMVSVRIREQKKAAMLGEYAAQVFMMYPSSAVKDASNQDIVNDITDLLRAARPKIVYTHNLADKHNTHVGVVIKVIEAIRKLPFHQHPQKLYGCEIWRDLGWMIDDAKVTFDCSFQQNLQAALLGVFDSQISGGKRYDLATMSRRLANATYFDPYNVDEKTGITVAMDLTPLISNPEMDIQAYVQTYIDDFSNDIKRRIAEMSKITSSN
ncbi:MAG: PIG-L family deacetylase [Anaerolineales bacterium]